MRPTSRRRLDLWALVVAATIAVCASLAVAVTSEAEPNSRGDAAVGSTFPQNQTGGRLDIPTPAVVDGVVQMPAPVAKRIAAINSAIEYCMIANGAAKVPLAQGGYYYTDSAATRGGACAREEKASNDYTNSREWREGSATVLPVAAEMNMCAAGRGLRQEYGHGDTGPSEQFIAAVLQECTADVNREFARAAG